MLPLAQGSSRETERQPLWKDGERRELEEPSIAKHPCFSVNKRRFINGVTKPREGYVTLRVRFRDDPGSRTMRDLVL